MYQDFSLPEPNFSAALVLNRSSTHSKCELGFNYQLYSPFKVGGSGLRPVTFNYAHSDHCGVLPDEKILYSLGCMASPMLEPVEGVHSNSYLQ